MHVVSKEPATSQDNLLVKLMDNRGWLERIYGFSLATVKEVTSRWQRQYNPLKVNVNELFPALQQNTNTYNIDEKKWKDSTKLVVLIHGLNSSPLAWTNYLERDDQESKISYFVPFVRNKGYCSCKEAARPILTVIQRYANQYRQKPIVLVGHSNGL